MAQFTYEIVKPIAVLSDSGTLTTELNIISYSGNEPKYDLRKWRTGNGEKKMQKGITLTRRLWNLPRISTASSLQIHR